MPDFLYPRIVAEVARLQWAITPEALGGITAALEGQLSDTDRPLFHTDSEEGFIEAVSQLGSRPEGSILTRINGQVGSLVINGPIVPRASAFLESSGIVSVERLMSEFKALEDDDSIKSILLVTDSPGGAVTGISEFASQVKSCEKSVTAYVTGSAASAAYWIVSAADKIVSSPTGLEGSVGALLTVEVDKDSKRFAIVSKQSPKKRLDASTEEGRAELQKIPTGLAQVFIDTVAANRGTTSENVIATYGQGAVLIAQDALAVGMIDKIDTLANTLKALNSSASDFNTALQAPAAQERSMRTLQELLAEHPNCALEIEKIKEDARKEGAEAARKKAKANTVAASTVLGSDKYKALHPMALKVLDGDLSPEGLAGAQAAFDAITAQNEEGKAIADSKGQPATPPQAAEALSEDGILRTTADIDAELAEMEGGN